jgi:hypothetical protein
VIKRRILPLFDSKTSVAFVVCAPGKVEAIKNGLENSGFVVEFASLKIASSEADEKD